MRRPLGGERFPAKQSLKPTCGDKFVADEKKGAIVLRLKQLKPPSRWDHATSVPVVNKFDLKEQGMVLPRLKFKKVNELWWGGGRFDETFYIMSGFHFRLRDNMQNLCHLQFWVAGKAFSLTAQQELY